MLRRLLGPVFIAAGINHFVIPKFYENMMPDYLPAHRELVVASGVAEIAGGAMAMSPKTRVAARWWLLGVLAAVTPVHVHMIQHRERYPKIPLAVLWIRLFLQLGWVAFIVKGTEPEGATANDAVTA